MVLTLLLKHELHLVLMHVYIYIFPHNGTTITLIQLLLLSK
jgi:hypothetical protein